METVIIDRKLLPETVFSYIQTEKIKIYEENGTITLTPFFDEKPHFDHLIGIFSDGRISIDDFLNEKQKEKGLEI